MHYTPRRASTAPTRRSRVGGQVGQKEQNEACNQHAACPLPRAQLQQLGEDGRGEDDAGEQVEDSP